MTKKKEHKCYSFDESFEKLEKLQQMAIEEGNINLALKAEEIKCKILTLQNENKPEAEHDDLTKILVDFIDDKQKSAYTADICTAADKKISL